MNKKFLSLLLVISLLLAMTIPTSVMASQTGTTNGSFTLNNVAPTITSVQIIPSTDGDPVTSMDPTVSYKAKIVASDTNTIDDIDQVRIVIAYDATDADPTTDPGETGDTKTLACLKWVKDGSVWSLSPNTDTTWSINSGNCVEPSNMTLDTGTWEFYFTVGEVATEAGGGTGVAGWDLFGEVYDGTAAAVEGWGDRDLAMNWYGSVTVNTVNANFGTPTLGTGFADNVNEVTDISVTYISNGDYDEQVSTATSWSGSGATATYDATGDCSSSNSFSLQAYYSDAFGSAVQVGTTATTIDNTGIQTNEGGDTVAANTLWLKIASSFTQDNYSGNITFTIANGS